MRALKIVAYIKDGYIFGNREMADRGKVRLFYKLTDKLDKNAIGFFVLINIILITTSEDPCLFGFEWSRIYFFEKTHLY